MILVYTVYICSACIIICLRVITYHHDTGFPAILAQFPETPQFRPAGWFCVAAGVTLLLLQLLLFHGECAWHCSKPIKKDLLRQLGTFTNHSWKKKLCVIFVSIINSVNLRLLFFLKMILQVPLYVIVTGGVKGMRYILVEVLLNPIISDTFGFSAKDSAVFFFVVFSTGPLIGSGLL